ncbi:hypothetical protein PENTCL1PPCAC_11997, partial [Pristionchus entomophagus]
AKFFCDYDPMVTKDMTRMSRTKGDAKADPQIESKLYCPSHPYPVIKGRTYKDPPIESTNDGGSFVWSMNNTKFIKRSDYVHCVDKMPCSEIPRSYRKNAFLNTENIPSCHQDGQLKMDDKQGKRRNAKFECESTTGELLVQFDGNTRNSYWESEKPENPKHVLFCVYPEPEDEYERIDRINWLDRIPSREMTETPRRALLPLMKTRTGFSRNCQWPSRFLFPRDIKRF